MCVIDEYPDPALVRHSLEPAGNGPCMTQSSNRVLERISYGQHSPNRGKAILQIVRSTKVCRKFRFRSHVRERHPEPVYKNLSRSASQISRIQAKGNNGNTQFRNPRLARRIIRIESPNELLPTLQR